jgi:hypothetical protein
MALCCSTAKEFNGSSVVPISKEFIPPAPLLLLELLTIITLA